MKTIIWQFIFKESIYLISAKILPLTIDIIYIISEIQIIKLSIFNEIFSFISNFISENSRIFQKWRIIFHE